MAHRPMFRRGHTFVVVRRIRLSSRSFLEVGDLVSLDTHKLWQLRVWYRRGRIAQAGCAWAESIMAGQFPSPTPVRSDPELRTSSFFPAVIEIVPDVRMTLAELTAVAHKESALSSADWNELSQADLQTLIGGTLQSLRAAQVRIVKSGSWYTVHRGDEELTKLHGRPALDEWMKANDLRGVVPDE